MVTHACWPYLLVAPLLGAPADAPRDATVIQAIIEGVLGRESLLINVRFRAKWLNYQRGKPSGWELQEVARDHLGRARLSLWFRPSGDHSLSLDTAERRDRVYDGELTAAMFFEASARPSKRQPAGRFWKAIINPGLFPAGVGLSDHRDAIRFCQNLAISRLGGVTPGDIALRQLAGGISQLRFQRDTDEVVLSVDVEKQHLVVGFDEASLDGTASLSARVESALETGGVWVPRTGWIRWGPPGTSGAPANEWRVTLESVTANDRNFDESIFAIKLPRGSYVVDNRHGCTYSITSEVAYAKDLLELARKAKEQPNRGYTTLTSRPSWPGIAIFAVSAMLVVISCVIVLARRHGRK